jgi:broad specificity phosphatase PhoE
VERAILVRHGESEFSALGLVNGDVAVDVPLTERGIEQARALAAELADDPIDLCVTSEFGRVRRTADLALAGRPVRRVVLPQLNDPRYGRFEGGPLDEYRSWADSRSSAEDVPGGGESRQVIVRRYVAGFRSILERPERTILVVTHSLPIAYVLAATAGRDPAPRVDLVEYARPYRLERGDLDRAVARLEGWVEAPTW